MKMEHIIMYINPQSMKNLSIYDHGVLSSFKDKVIYVCSTYYDYKAMNDNIAFIRLFKYNRISNPIVKAASYLLSLARLLILIMHTRPEILHIQWFRIPYVDYCFYSLIKTMFKTKIVYTAHNILPHNTGDTYKHTFCKAYRMFDKIIVHSQRSKDELCSTFNINGDNIHVVRHGLLNMPYDIRLLKTNEHQYLLKYDIKHKTVFLSLGEQSPYKGIDLLAKIWAETPELRNNKNIALVVAGKQKGIDISCLNGIDNAIVENRVLPNDEFIFLLQHANVYLLPYKTISQSGAMLTALSEKIPVLVSDVGGLTEPFSISKVGWVVPANDTDALRSQLVYLSKHIEEISYVKNDVLAWKKIAMAFNWEKISNETLKVYFSI